jgi:hypothetical protein
MNEQLCAVVPLIAAHLDFSDLVRLYVVSRITLSPDVLAVAQRHFSLRRRYSLRTLCYFIARSARCRNCGHPRGRRVSLRGHRGVTYVCVACRKHSEYFGMMSRAAIRAQNRLREPPLGYTALRHVFRSLHVTCRGGNKEYLYWKADVTCHMNGL